MHDTVLCIGTLSVTGVQTKVHTVLCIGTLSAVGVQLVQLVLLVLFLPLVCSGMYSFHGLH